MPAPTIGPGERDPASVAPTGSYRRADPVWAYCSNTWCAAVVEYVSARAATVTYRPANSRGTGVDTLTAAYLMSRDDLDPVLDRRPLPGVNRLGRASQG
jgi:hypothetical protein